jgi:hypothetical protein
MTEAILPRDYYFFGRRLHSPFALASLPLWPETESEVPPEIVLRFGDTPEALPHSVWSSPFIQIGADKSALVSIAAVARFWIPPASENSSSRVEIVIQPTPGAEPYEIETFLVGTVAGIVLHRLGMLPLHASCVEFEGRAIAIAGSAATGKSTLAAALVRRGARLLSDDLCVFHTSNGCIQTVTGTVQARLWPDVMDHLDIPLEMRLPTRPGHGKHAVSLPAGEARFWPFHFLLGIEVGFSSPEPMLEPQQGLAAFVYLKAMVYQPQIGHVFGDYAREFRALAAFAQQVSRFSLKRSRYLRDLDQCVDLILQLIQRKA